MALSQLSKMFKNGLVRFKVLRSYSQTEAIQRVHENCPFYFQLCQDFNDENAGLAEDLINTKLRKKSLLDEIEPYMKKLRYEFDHWDDAIHGYRETERLSWNKENTNILDRVREIAFPPTVEPLKFVHILDLDKNGYIKPHIDAIRFCGDTIAGLSLLTNSVMRLVHDKNKNLYADILLKRRSLYIMKGTARFDYTHEILSNEHSVFGGKKILKDRRISVICRNEPDPKNKNL
ncbi:hypothetical protein NQ318_016540 [Aromia moschata]|uniref:Alpha-ketoglutarate-dependent dioxygenase AlkB-like domain-containing protein n=1 Tax=Aromia moschata TaxID=1265417 RepID=A0AAV8YWP1_9CUCU|nr:hypothetical protein NQ318_016540 [Aromia moschata]